MVSFLWPWMLLAAAGRAVRGRGLPGHRAASGAASGQHRPGRASGSTDGSGRSASSSSHRAAERSWRPADLDTRPSLAARRVHPRRAADAHRGPCAAPGRGRHPARGRAPSSSPSMCPAAWPPTTSRRRAWRRPRQPPPHSCSASRTSVVIGVVAFSDSGLSVQAPTNDQAAVLAAIQRLQPQRGTSLARGHHGIAGDHRGRGGRPRTRATTPTGRPRRPPSHHPCRRAATPRRSSCSCPMARTPSDSDPLEAAQAAADRGVRIDTVGIGSAAGDHARGGGLQRPHPARRAGCSSRSPRSPAAATTGPTARTRCTPSTTASIRVLVVARRVPGGDRAGGRRRARAAAHLGGVARCSGWVGCHDPAVAGRAGAAAAHPAAGRASISGSVRHRARPAVRYSSLSLIAAAQPGSSRVRRHLPFALFLAAVAALVVALARPAAVVDVPTGGADHPADHGCLAAACARPISSPAGCSPRRPRRRTSSSSSRPRTQIGIVAFSGFAELVQAPTTDKQLLLDAVHSFTTGRRTAVGSGILAAIDAIADIDPEVAHAVTDTSTTTPPTPVVPGDYAPAIIVVLTDGASNAGADPADAAQQAADRGLRVYTIGFGTAQVVASTRRAASSSSAGSRTAASVAARVASVAGTPAVAADSVGAVEAARADSDGASTRTRSSRSPRLTGGQYYPAESASELQSVFRGLPTSTITAHEVVELSVVFAGRRRAAHAARALACRNAGARCPEAARPGRDSVGPDVARDPDRLARLGGLVHQQRQVVVLRAVRQGADGRSAVEPLIHPREGAWRRRPPRPRVAPAGTGCGTATPRRR